MKPDNKEKCCEKCYASANAVGEISYDCNDTGCPCHLPPQKPEEKVNFLVDVGTPPEKINTWNEDKQEYEERDYSQAYYFYHEGRQAVIAELVEEIEKMKTMRILLPKNVASSTNAKFKTQGYHQALSDILSKLKSKK